MRHPVFVLSLLGLAIAATPAIAGIVVIGHGVGRDCYEQTLLEPSPIHNLQALQVCDRAVEDYTGDAYNRAAAFINRSDILLRMQRYKDAVSDSDRGIAIDAKLSVAHLNRGAGMIGLERYNEAITSLNLAIDMGVSKLQLAYFDRGLAKENLGDARGAYYDYRKATELDPTFQLAADQLSRFTVTRRQVN